MARLMPTDKGYPRALKRYLAIERYARAYRAYGYEHPATRAALGRMWFHKGRVPQTGQDSIEAVAWERESGRTPGYMNRTQRTIK